MIVDSNELSLAKTLVSATEIVLTSVQDLSGSEDCHVLCRNNDSLVRFDVGIAVNNKYKCRTFTFRIGLSNLNLNTLPLTVIMAYNNDNPNN